MVLSNTRPVSPSIHTDTAHRLPTLIADLLPVLGVVPAALHMPLPTSAGIEDVASPPSDIRRGIYCKESAIGQVGSARRLHVRCRETAKSLPALDILWTPRSSDM